MPHNLVDVLNRVGKLTELYTSTDGSNILVLPYGGRVLGLFAPRRKENFFWTHPALASVESARAFYESGVWHNSQVWAFRALPAHIQSIALALLSPEV